MSSKSKRKTNTRKISKAWNANKSFKKPFEYVMQNNPEQTLTIQRMDMADLMKLGVSDQMDFMSKALMQNTQPEDAKPVDAVKDAISKSANLGKMEQMVNAVCMAGVLDPFLTAIPLDEDGDPVPADERKDDGEIFYVDWIPFEDRMELFGVIYDSEGLSDFREKQENAVGDVANVQDVQLPANGSVGVRPDNAEGVLLQQGSNEIRSDGGVGTESSGEPVSQGQETGTGDRPVGEGSQAGGVGETFGSEPESAPRPRESVEHQSV